MADPNPWPALGVWMLGGSWPLATPEPAPAPVPAEKPARKGRKAVGRG